MSTITLNGGHDYGARARAEAGSARAGASPMLWRLAISVAAVLLTLGLARAALHRFDTPVRELAVSGALQNVRPDEVRAAAAPLLGAELFDLDLAAIRASVERLPWVARVRIDRQWPMRLAVRVTEREPFARWGSEQALSTEGVVFAPGSVVLPSTLPILGGAEGREREVMAMYGQLADHLSETPLALKGLVQDARGEWTGTTERGISLRFGRNNPVEQLPRLKNTVLPALNRRLDAVARIDLRYANGFAVGWRDASETSDAPLSTVAPTSTAPRLDAAPGATP